MLSPQISRHFIQQQLTPHTLSLAGQSHVRYNPFLSKISVENFVITKNKSIVLAIKKLDLGVSLYQLLFDRIYIKQLDLDGFFIKVIQNDQLIEVAGFSLASNQKSNADEPSSSDPMNYELILPLLKIQNAKIGYESNGRKLEFIATYLSTKNIVVDSQKQSGQFQLNGKLEQGTINLSGNFSMLAKQRMIESIIDITQLDLSLISPWLPKQSQINSGLLNVSGQQKAHLIGREVDLALTNSQVHLEQLELVHNNITVSVDQQEFYAANLGLHVNKESVVTMSGQGQYTLDHLTVTNKENKQLLLASIRKVLLPVITIEESEFSPMISLPTVAINKIILSDELTTQLPPILRIEQTQLTDVTISESKTEINTVTIGGLAIDTYITSTKEVDNLKPVQFFIAKNNAVSINDSSAQKPSSQPSDNNQADKITPPVESTKSTYHLKLNQLSFSDPAAIHLVDASIKPHYKRTYTIDKFVVGPIDTLQPHQKTMLTIAGQSDEYENFNLTSVNQLFAKKPSYSVKGYINEINLSAISPYVSSALKHDIKSGQLNLKIDTTINNDELSGNTEILIRHIEFSTGISTAPSVVNTTTSMPLNIALDLLKDSDGNVDLSIPLSGNINAPEFGLINITTFLVKKASMMAAKDYLMKTFVPYANVVSIAMSAADTILKVRFNDLFFITRQVQTSITDDVYLSQFAQLLIDKPDTHVTICPIAVPEDVNLKNGKEVTEPEVIDQLNQVSLQRFNRFKTLMTKQYKIPTSRLILCAPSVDFSDNAKPRLSFST